MGSVDAVEGGAGRSAAALAGAKRRRDAIAVGRVGVGGRICAMESKDHRRSAVGRYTIVWGVDNEEDCEYSVL